MQVLIVDAFREGQPGKPLLDHAAVLLASAGHSVRRTDPAAEGFVPFMSEEERRRYHDEGDNICAVDVERAASELRAADAVLFGYHTTLHTIPAHLKGWLERTMVPGVGFVLNENNKVRPGLGSVRRIGAITTTPHGRRATLAARDGGRRTLMRSFRANCAPRCRRTFLSIPVDDADAAAPRVTRALRSW